MLLIEELSQLLIKNRRSYLLYSFKFKVIGYERNNRNPTRIF